MNENIFKSYICNVEALFAFWGMAYLDEWGRASLWCLFNKINLEDISSNQLHLMMVRIICPFDALINQAHPHLLYWIHEGRVADWVPRHSFLAAMGMWAVVQVKQHGAGLMQPYAYAVPTQLFHA